MESCVSVRASPKPIIRAAQLAAWAKKPKHERRSIRPNGCPKCRYSPGCTPSCFKKYYVHAGLCEEILQVLLSSLPAVFLPLVRSYALCRFTSAVSQAPEASRSGQTALEGCALLPALFTNKEKPKPYNPKSLSPKPFFAVEWEDEPWFSLL